jgi:hypothetical protein
MTSKLIKVNRTRGKIENLKIEKKELHIISYKLVMRIAKKEDFSQKQHTLKWTLLATPCLVGIYPILQRIW